MQKSLAETWTLRTCDCDMGDGWRPGAVLEAMQESAGAHCEQLGIGRAVLDNMGILWVLSRARVAFDRVPRRGERVTVETWPLPRRHLFYPRANRFADADGRTIGTATSLWLLLDAGTRRGVVNDVVNAHLPENADLPAGPGAPAAVRPLAAEPVRGVYRPVYTDFDLNGHVNNTRYLDWCCNALGVQALGARQLMRFEICYEAEVRPGASIDTELAVDGDAFTFLGSEAGKRCFAVGGTLAAREG